MPKTKTLYGELLANAKPSTRPHPLESVVWQAFDGRNAHDSSSLGYFLAGALVRGGSKAYRTVALDVLGYMEGQGLLERDGHWWRKVTPTKETHEGQDAHPRYLRGQGPSG